MDKARSLQLCRLRDAQALPLAATAPRLLLIVLPKHSDTSHPLDLFHYVHLIIISNLVPYLFRVRGCGPFNCARTFSKAALIILTRLDSSSSNLTINNNDNNIKSLLHLLPMVDLDLKFPLSKSLYLNLRIKPPLPLNMVNYEVNLGHLTITIIIRTLILPPHYHPPVAQVMNLLVRIMFLLLHELYSLKDHLIHPLHSPSQQKLS